MHVALKCVHGDLKPRNIVKIVFEGKEQYILIDLDASCRLGMPAGQKVEAAEQRDPARPVSAAEQTESI